MEKVRIGVIGLGGMGQAHINKIKEIPEAELTAVSDVDSEITKKIFQEHKVPGFTDYEKLLKKEEQTLHLSCLHFLPSLK